MMVGPRSNRAIVVISPPNYSGSVKDVFRKAKITACRDNAFQSICDDFYPTSDRIEFFQPEPGCSDATFIGSAADICTLTASMLNVAAVELSKAPIDAHAFLLTQPYIVYANPEESAITHFKWPKDIVICASYEIRVALNAWSEIVGWIRNSSRKKGKAVETGGVLFGKRDDSLRVIWIDAVSGPPPDSRSSRTEFVCGTKGVEEMHESWKKLTRGSVEFIGMWHTHPEDMPIPSTRDICGMAQILTIGDPPAKKSLLLIVGLLSNNPVLGVTVFERITATDNPEMIQANVETAVLSGLKI